MSGVLVLLWEDGRISEAQGLAWYTQWWMTKRPCFKHTEKCGSTPNVAFCASHVCCSMHTPASTHMSHTYTQCSCRQGTTGWNSSLGGNQALIGSCKLRGSASLLLPVLAWVVLFPKGFLSLGGVHDSACGSRQAHASLGAWLPATRSVGAPQPWAES